MLSREENDRVSGELRSMANLERVRYKEQFYDRLAEILFGFDWPDYDFVDVADRLARLIYPRVCEDIESDERGDNDAV